MVLFRWEYNQTQWSKEPANIPAIIMSIPDGSLELNSVSQHITVILNQNMSLPLNVFSAKWEYGIIDLIPAQTIKQTL